MRVRNDLARMCANLNKSGHKYLYIKKKKYFLNVSYVVRGMGGGGTVQNIYGFYVRARAQLLPNLFCDDLIAL